MGECVWPFQVFRAARRETYRCEIRCSDLPPCFILSRAGRNPIRKLAYCSGFSLQMEDPRLDCAILRPMESDGDHFLAYYLTQEDTPAELFKDSRFLDDTNNPVRSISFFSFPAFYTLSHGAIVTPIVPTTIRPSHSFGCATTRQSKSSKMCLMSFYSSLIMAIYRQRAGSTAQHLSDGQKVHITRTLSVRSRLRRSV